MTEILKWYPDRHTLAGPTLIQTWGTDEVSLTETTERQTLGRLSALGERVLQAGNGLGGPFPLAAAHSWVSARWMAEARLGFIAVRWRNLEEIAALHTRYTRSLRLAQAARWADQLPALPPEHLRLLSRMRGSEDPYPLVTQLLQRNPALILRLILAANRISLSPVKTGERALALLGGGRALDILRALIFINALPVTRHLDSVLSSVSLALQSFEAVFRGSSYPAQDWPTALCGLVFGEALLAHFGGNEDLYTSLQSQIVDIFAIQRFVYGIHALEVCQEVFRHWDIPVNVPNSAACQYLSFVADSLPLLRRLPSLFLKYPDVRKHWLKKGVLLLREPTPLWAELTPTEQERLLDFFHFLDRAEA